jgi:magnesium chelatase family protein
VPLRLSRRAWPGLRRAPRCAQDYQARISGPLLDRIDLHIDVPAVSPADLALPPPAETSAEIARRVAAARARQRARYETLPPDRRIRANAEVDGDCSTRSPPPTRPAAPCCSGPPNG